MLTLELALLAECIIRKNKTKILLPQVIDTHFENIRKKSNKLRKNMSFVISLAFDIYNSCIF